MGQPVVHFEIVGTDPQQLRGYVNRAMFYVAVPDVEDALQQAERLGGTRRMGLVSQRAPQAQQARGSHA
ncbi:MAG TPA: hypothetical protein VFD41_01480 [Actinomycetales bacterium]|nr:hypothetical protein [Actinomycetales bacterium]